MKKKRRKNIVSQSWIIFIWISPLFLQKRRKPTKYLENTTIIIPQKPRNSEFFEFPTFQYQKSTLPITHWGKLAIFAKNYKNENIEKNENFGDKN